MTWIKIFIAFFFFQIIAACFIFYGTVISETKIKQNRLRNQKYIQQSGCQSRHVWINSRWVMECIVIHKHPQICLLWPVFSVTKTFYVSLHIFGYIFKEAHGFITSKSIILWFLPPATQRHQESILKQGPNVRELTKIIGELFIDETKTVGTER